MNRKEIKEFLEDNKQHIGFADYKLTVKYDKVFVDEELANVTTDRLEKTLVIDIGKAFFKEKEPRQRNILLHELIHGRYGVYEEKVKSKIDKIRRDEEEEMINDFTRMLEAGVIE